MAMLDLSSIEPVVTEQAEPRHHSLRPDWANSAVPWIVTGAVALAALVTAIVTFSVRLAGETTDQQRTDLFQSCLAMGGTTEVCSAAVGGPAANSGDTAADYSTSDSIAS